MAPFVSTTLQPRAPQHGQAKVPVGPLHALFQAHRPVLAWLVWRSPMRARPRTDARRYVVGTCLYIVTTSTDGPHRGTPFGPTFGRRDRPRKIFVLLDRWFCALTKTNGGCLVRPWQRVLDRFLRHGHPASYFSLNEQQIIFTPLSTSSRRERGLWEGSIKFIESWVKRHGLRSHMPRKKAHICRPTRPVCMPRSTLVANTATQCCRSPMYPMGDISDRHPAGGSLVFSSTLSYGRANIALCQADGCWLIPRFRCPTRRN
jgi:hypothetical protein